MALFIVERVGTGFTVRPGENALQAAASALKAEAWAEGTLPGGAGTKSAKEHAEDAAASVASIDGLEATIARTQENQLDYFQRDQLFDPTAALDNKTVANGLVGQLFDDPGFAATDFIAWPEGVTQATLSRGERIAQYRLTGGEYVFVAGSSVNPQTPNYTLSKVAGATHFRASINKFFVSIANFSITPGPSLILPKPAFAETIEGSAIKRASLPGAALEDASVTPTKTSFVAQGKNLFDKNATTAGSAQSTGSVVVQIGRQLSDFIPITPGVTYQYRSAAGGARFRAVFDAGKVNRGAPNSTTTDGTTSYTAVAGDAFMRLTIENARANDFQVEAGPAPTGYERFGFKLTDDIVNAGGGAASSEWANKVCISYGDSLTAQQQWQPPLAQALGLLHTAFGVGGRTIGTAAAGGDPNHMYAQATIDALPASIDLLLVLGATNDWSQSVPLGVFKTVTGSGSTSQTVLNSNPAQFYGALNLMCERLTVRYPTTRIVLCCPPHSERPSRVTDGIWGDALTNQQGLTLGDYSDAMRVAADYWNLPFIDFREAGINSANKTTYHQNDGGWIHPNALGGARMAAVAVGRLRDIEPLA